MPATVEQLYLEALSLPPEARADLTDRLVAGNAEAIDPELEQAHIAEVRRRIADIEADKVQLIPAEQVMAEGLAMLTRLLSERQTQ